MFRKIFSSQLRINMVSGVAATVVNAAVLAIGYPVYLHFLGYEQYGVWLVLATVLHFAQLGNLGIGRAVMKLVAEEHGRGDVEAIQKYLVAAIVILVASGALVLIGLLSFKSQIVQLFRLSAENEEIVRWLLPYIGCLSIYVFVVQALNAAVSGLGRMDLANWTQSFGRIVAVTAAAGLLYGGRGIESLLIGNALSYVLIHMVSVAVIWRMTGRRLLRVRHLSRRCMERLLRFGLGLLGGSLMDMLLSPFNKLMLSRYAGVSTIPVYEIAYTGGMQVRGLLEAGLRALMPEVSRLGANLTAEARDRIRHIHRRAVWLLCILGLPLYGALIVLITPLLKLWLGQRFIETLPAAFRVMLIGSFLSLLCAPAYYTILGLGRVRQCFYAHAIQAGTNVLGLVLIVLLLPALSVIRVVWAVVAAMGLTSTYLMVQKHRTLRSAAQHSL